MDATPDIDTHPIHLGLGAAATAEPEFIGELAWYEGYVERHTGDGAEGRLVAMHSFTGDWDSWEVHPNGAEVVLCLDGAITVHQEHADGSSDTVELTAGRYAINPPGTWHTADVADSARVLFITPGLGTEHRPR